MEIQDLPLEKRLALAVIQSWAQGEYIGNVKYRVGYCVHCQNEAELNKEIIHKEDCIVLIAKKVLKRKAWRERLKFFVRVALLYVWRREAKRNAAA